MFDLLSDGLFNLFVFLRACVYVFEYGDVYVCLNVCLLCGRLFVVCVRVCVCCVCMCVCVCVVCVVECVLV